MLPNNSAMDCEISKDIYVSPSEDDHNQDVEREENEEIAAVDIWTPETCFLGAPSDSEIPESVFIPDSDENDPNAVDKEGLWSSVQTESALIMPHNPVTG